MQLVNTTKLTQNHVQSGSDTARACSFGIASKPKANILACAWIPLCLVRVVTTMHPQMLFCRRMYISPTNHPMSTNISHRTAIGQMLGKCGSDFFAHSSSVCLFTVPVHRYYDQTVVVWLSLGLVVICIISLTTHEQQQQQLPPPQLRRRQRLSLTLVMKSFIKICNRQIVLPQHHGQRDGR